MKKSIKVLLMACLLCATFVSGVLASTNETISAVLNRTIKVTYNGVYQTFSDVTGTTVYPISYNGTTYLPVRSVAGLVGLSVDYDNDTETVILGDLEQEETYLINQENSGATDYSAIIRSSDDLTVVGDSATMTYANGISWSQWNGFASYTAARVMFFDVSGYSSITFTAWSDVDAKVMLVDSEGNNIYTFEKVADSIETKTIDISGYETIGFASNAPSIFNNNDGTLRIFEPTLN